MALGRPVRPTEGGCVMEDKPMSPLEQANPKVVGKRLAEARKARRVTNRNGGLSAPVCSHCFLIQPCRRLRAQSEVASVATSARSQVERPWFAATHPSGEVLSAVGAVTFTVTSNSTFDIPSVIVTVNRCTPTSRFFKTAFGTA